MGNIRMRLLAEVAEEISEVPAHLRINLYLKEVKILFQVHGKG
jgi:hypothetical protein